MRTIVITGASDGIGSAAAELIAGEEHRVVLVGRSEEKTTVVAERLGADYHLADFARLEEVRDLADALLDSCPQIDVLANNAGGLFSGPRRTEDGFEKTFQVDHLAPFLLTHLLRDRLLASGAAVVNTSSLAARFARLDLDDLNGFEKYRPGRAYSNAKLANVLFTKGLHERYGRQGLTSVAFHPGGVGTNFAANTSSPARWLYHGPLARFLISPEQGGATLAYFVTGEPGDTWISGEYYDDHRRIARTHRAASDPSIVRAHWETSARMLGLED